MGLITEKSSVVSFHVCERYGLLMFLRLCSKKLPGAVLRPLLAGPLRFTLTSQARFAFLLHVF